MSTEFRLALGLVIKLIHDFYKDSFISIRVWLRWGLSKRGFWTRAFLCLLFSLIILKFDEVDTYDKSMTLKRIH